MTVLDAVDTRSPPSMHGSQCMQCADNDQQITLPQPITDTHNKRTLNITKDPPFNTQAPRIPWPPQANMRCTPQKTRRLTIGGKFNPPPALISQARPSAATVAWRASIAPPRPDSNTDASTPRLGYAHMLEGPARFDIYSILTSPTQNRQVSGIASIAPPNVCLEKVKLSFVDATAASQELVKTTVLCAALGVTSQADLTHQAQAAGLRIDIYPDKKEVKTKQHEIVDSAQSWTVKLSMDRADDQPLLRTLAATVPGGKLARLPILRQPQPGAPFERTTGIPHISLPGPPVPSQPKTPTNEADQLSYQAKLAAYGERVITARISVHEVQPSTRRLPIHALTDLMLMTAMREAYNEDAKEYEQELAVLQYEDIQMAHTKGHVRLTLSTPGSGAELTACGTVIANSSLGQLTLTMEKETPPAILHHSVALSINNTAPLQSGDTAIELLKMMGNAAHAAYSAALAEEPHTLKPPGLEALAPPSFEYRLQTLTEAVSPLEKPITAEQALQALATSRGTPLAVLIADTTALVEAIGKPRGMVIVALADKQSKYWVLRAIAEGRVASREEGKYTGASANASKLGHTPWLGVQQPPIAMGAAASAMELYRIAYAMRRNLTYADTPAAPDIIADASLRKELIFALVDIGRAASPEERALEVQRIRDAGQQGNKSPAVKAGEAAMAALSGAKRTLLDDLQVPLSMADYQPPAELSTAPTPPRIKRRQQQMVEAGMAPQPTPTADNKVGATCAPASETMYHTSPPHAQDPHWHEMHDRYHLGTLLKSVGRKILADSCGHKNNSLTRDDAHCSDETPHVPAPHVRPPHASPLTVYPPPNCPMSDRCQPQSQGSKATTQRETRTWTGDWSTQDGHMATPHPQQTVRVHGGQLGTTGNCHQQPRERHEHQYWGGTPAYEHHPHHSGSLQLTTAPRTSQHMRMGHLRIQRFTQSGSNDSYQPTYSQGLIIIGIAATIYLSTPKQQRHHTTTGACGTRAMHKRNALNTPHTPSTRSHRLTTLTTKIRNMSWRLRRKHTKWHVPSNQPIVAIIHVSSPHAKKLLVTSRVYQHIHSKPATALIGVLEGLKAHPTISCITRKHHLTTTMGTILYDIAIDGWSVLDVTLHHPLKTARTIYNITHSMALSPRQKRATNTTTQQMLRTAMTNANKYCIDARTILIMGYMAAMCTRTVPTQSSYMQHAHMNLTEYLGHPTVTMWNNPVSCYTNDRHMKMHLVYILTICGNIELNPGPPSTSTTPLPTPQGIYWERQENSFCYMHSLNMLLGYRLFEGHHVVAKLTEDAESCTDTREGASLKSMFRQTGPFTSTAINRYLYTHTTPKVFLRTCRFTTPTCPDPTTEIKGLTKERLLAQLPPACTAFLVAYRTNSGVSHMKCIKKNTVNDKWYSLDSWVEPFVQELTTDAHWEAISGEVAVLAKGDAYRLNIVLHPPPKDLQQEKLDQRAQPLLDPRTDHLAISDTPVRGFVPSPLQTAHTTVEPPTDQTPPTQQAPPNTMTSQQGTQPSPDSNSHSTLTDITCPHTRDGRQKTGNAPTTKPQKRRSVATQRQRKRQGQDIRSFFAPKTTAQEPQPTPQPQTQEPDKQDLMQDHTTTIPTTAPCPAQCNHQDAQHTPPCLSMKVLNVRGLQSSQVDVYNMAKHSQAPPDVIVLTETKTTRQSQRRMHIRKALSDYHVHCSNVSDKQNPQAGVLIAVSKTFSELGTVAKAHVDPWLQGYLAHVQVTMPYSNTLHIVGVYCPNSQPGDHMIRREIYKACTNLLIETPSEGHTIILAGDFNATLQTSDRHTNNDTHADIAHRAFVQQANLTPADPIPAEGQARPYTFRKGMESTPVSRIDDVYLNLTMEQFAQAKKDGMHVSVEDMTGTRTDHNEIAVHIPFTSLGVIPPPTHSIETRTDEGAKLRTPMSKEDKTKLQLALNHEHESTWAEFERRLTHIVDGQSCHNGTTSQSPHDPLTPTPIHRLNTGQQTPRQMVDELGEQLMDLLVACKDTALETCSTVPIARSWKKWYRPRAIARQRKRLVRLRKEVAQEMRHSQTLKPTIWHTDPSQNGHVEGTNDIKTESLQCANDDTTTQHSKRYQELNKEIAAIDKEYLKFHAQEDVRRLQQRMDEKQSLGNKEATGQHKPAPHSALKIMKTEDGRMVTDPQDIINIVEKYYSKKLEPGPNAKNGKYLPHEAPRNYPWQARQAIDKFTLTKPSHTAMPDMYQAIDDEAAFHDCIKTLSHGKTAGPDGVANEILQALPATGKRAIHQMLKIMWVTGLTPDKWKQSTTILLYKNKGTPLELAYYRRIGLELTIYKLWTRMVTYAMTDYAERHGILSSSQAGFRSKRTTVHQMELMVMALEDAHLCKQDIYLLQADMTEAFDTILHDKLLIILYDLGFPADAIEVVRDLYTNACTRVQTPHGPTKSLTINRGTIQGDSLSPFLFILYLEPLLRWLKQGDRGYHFGALKTLGQEREATQITDITYADDVNILTDSLENLKTQTRKLSEYSDWGGLTVNNTKTTATGALHGTQPQRPYDEALLQTQLSHTVKVQGNCITYHPPQTPFRHLGVYLTMDLNFKPQVAIALAKVKEKITHLHKSCGTTAQKQRIIETCIRPAITYAFPIAPYTIQEIKRLDSLLTTATKQAFGIGTCMSTAAAHQDKHLGGLGCHSLEVEYHTISTQRLIRALNDKGHLGRISRAMYERQIKGLTALTAREIPHTLNHSMRMRQLIALNTTNLTLRKEGQPADTYPDMSLLEKSVQQALSTANTDTCHPQLTQDIHLLHQLGITNIQQLLDSTWTSMLPASELRKMLGSRHVRPKHLRALNRLTEYVCTAEITQSQRGPTPVMDKPPNQRKLHPTVKANISTHTHHGRKGPAPTPLQLLLAPTTVHRKIVMEARDKMYDYLRKLMTPELPVPKANIREIRPQPESMDPKKSRRNPTATCFATGYSQFQQIPKRKKRTEKDIKTLHNLYTRYAHTPDHIEEVLGLALATAHKGTGKKRIAVDQQPQASVKWAPTIGPAWLTEAAKALRYTPKTAVLATPEDIQQAKDFKPPCEICTKATTYGEIGVLTCMTCQRSYHARCCGEDCNTASQPPVQDDTYTCFECRTKQYTSANLPSDLKLVKVTWNITEEGYATVRQVGSESAKARLEELIEERATSSNSNKQPRTTQTRPTAYQPPINHTHFADDNERVYDITIGQEKRKKLIIHTTAINPHVDIHATHQHDVMMREVLMRKGTVTGKSHTRSVPLACVYEPDGRSHHMLAPERAAFLHAAYTQVMENCPHLIDKMKIQTFATEVTKLITRYTEGSPIPKCRDGIIKTINQRALHPSLHTVIQQHTQSSTERFASPLNVHPGTQTYWSIHPRDKIFGARINAYKAQWTGTSTATPDFEECAMDKAMAWAIHSAQHATTPTVTTLIMPTSTNTACQPTYVQRIRQHPQYCKIILTLPRKHLTFAEPGIYPHITHGGATQTSKWDMNIIAIGNQQGFAQYMPYHKDKWLNDFKLEMCETMSQVYGHQVTPQALRAHMYPQASSAPTPHISTTTNQPLHDTAHNVPASFPPDSDDTPTTNRYVERPIPAKFKDLPQDYTRQPNTQDLCTTLNLPRNATTAALHLASIAYLKTHLPAATPLRHKWNEFVYTDGSVTPPLNHSPGIGAAVYIPPKDTHGDTTDEGQILMVHCAHSKTGVDDEEYDRTHGDRDLTCVNTINRAELAGIATALGKGHHNIATDSLASMYQCLRIIKRPQDMQEHRHHSLLEHISRLIEASQHPIHLWKVKSHIGIVGNEWADEAAVAVATGAKPLEAAEETRFTVQSNNRHYIYWPYTPPPPKPPNTDTDSLLPPQQVPPQTDRQLTYTPLANLAETLKSRSHDMHKLGKSNIHTVYFNSWNKIQDNIDHKSSHTFMTSTLITPAERRYAIQYRNGLLYTQKLAKRYNHATSSKCVLCNLEDGGHHAVSGCNALTAAVTKRHNQAGREIVKAISKGLRAQELIMSDVGMRKHLPRETPHQMTSRIPASILPNTMSQELKQHLCTASIPDALLYRPPTAAHEGAQYTIVEIKYCRDTRPEDQEERAQQQHKELVDNIKTHDRTATVHQSVILLGVSGAMYKSSIEELEDNLGIKGSQLRGLIKRLHIHAIKSLASTLHYRHKLINKTGAPRGARATERMGGTHGRARPHGQLDTGHRKAKRRRC